MIFAFYIVFSIELCHSRESFSSVSVSFYTKRQLFCYNHKRIHTENELKLKLCCSSFHFVSLSHSFSVVSTFANILFDYPERESKKKAPAHLIESTIYIITQINTFILEKFLFRSLFTDTRHTRTREILWSCKIQTQYNVFNFMFDDIKGKVKSQFNITIVKIVQPVKAVDVNCRKSLLKN